MSAGCVTTGTLTVCLGPPMEVIRRDELGERWCFVCRRRAPFALTISAPKGLSYYGPSATVACERGHNDGDLFPGRYREWEEAS